MESRLCKLYVVHTKDGKGVTDQRYLTEKLMNKLQNLYGINQLKLALGVVRLHFIILSLIVKIERSCYLFCLRTP